MLSTINDFATLIFLLLGLYFSYKAIFGDMYSRDPVSHTGTHFVYAFLCFLIAMYAQLTKAAHG